MLIINADSGLVSTDTGIPEMAKDLHVVQIPPELKGVRLDKALAIVFPDYSRTNLQAWLDEGRISIDNEFRPRRYSIKGGETVKISVPEAKKVEWDAENIPLDILYEDKHLIVISKPAGLVVHPGAGNRSGTLLNALLAHDTSLATLPRAGIVHRLDKNTSGLLVIAKTEPARLNLMNQLKNRSVERVYLAITVGRLVAGGTIDVPIGRNPKNRLQMSAGRGKRAVSHYRVVTRYRAHTLIRVTLDTGRTHQIRVHLRHAGYPLVGDPDYGQRTKLPPKATDKLISALRQFNRQALHAEKLNVVHPASGESMSWHVGLPKDMRELLLALKQDSERTKE